MGVPAVEGLIGGQNGLSIFLCPTGEHMNLIEERDTQLGQLISNPRRDTGKFMTANESITLQTLEGAYQHSVRNCFESSLQVGKSQRFIPQRNENG